MGGSIIGTHSLPGFGVRVGGGRPQGFHGDDAREWSASTLHPQAPIPQLSLADGRKQAEKIVTDAQVGLDPAGQDQSEKRQESQTFGAVAADFMRDFAKNHRTRNEMQRKIDVELLPGVTDR